MTVASMVHSVGYFQAVTPEVAPLGFATTASPLRADILTGS